MYYYYFSLKDRKKYRTYGLTWADAYSPKGLDQPIS